MTARRVAYVEIDAEVLRHVVGPMLDGGLRIVGSLEKGFSVAARTGTVLLIVEGDVLPESCGPNTQGLSLPLQQVVISLDVETYGEQHIARLGRIEVAV